MTGPNLADNGRAQQLFQRAAEIDPTFASACAAMAISYLNEGSLNEGSTYAARPLPEAVKLADFLGT